MSKNGKINSKILFAFVIMASLMISFNLQGVNMLVTDPSNSSQAITSATTSTVNHAKIETVNKISSQNQTKTINLFSDLVKESSVKQVKVSSIASPTPQIKKLASLSSIIYTNISFYLLNFTFQNVYFTKAQTAGTGLLNYDLHPNVTITSYAFFPVVLSVYSNNSIEAGTWNTITTQVLTDVYNASVGFDINFGLNYKVWADVFGTTQNLGPDSFITSFHQEWNFPIPFDGNYIGNREDFTLPVGPFPLLSVGLAVQPKIDANMASLVQANNQNIFLTQQNLLWQNSNSIQSFSYETPISYDKPTAPINMLNFNMDFTLSLEFFLRFKVNLPILDSYPLDIHIFSLPLASLNLPLVGSVGTNATVTPSNKVPYIYGVNYDFNDHNDHILQPGEVANLTFQITNIGQGPATNVTVTSQNTTLTGSYFTPLIAENMNDVVTINNFYFTVPSPYSSNLLILEVAFAYYAPNGTQYTSTFDLYFRVVHTGDSYLQISNVYAFTPGLTQWNAGDNLDLMFNVTNRGGNAITNSDITAYSGFDTDTINSVSFTSIATNSSGTININQSVILGNISLSSPSNHQDGLVYLYLFVNYNDSINAWHDLFYIAIPITSPKPSFQLDKSIGYDLNNNNVFMAGDPVNLEFEIQNIGQGTGYTISADLYSYSPDLNFTNSHLNFANLNPAQKGNSSYGSLIISPYAKNQTAIFSITIYAYDSLGNFISQSFNVSIAIVELPPPQIQLIGYILLDSNLNTVTTPQPGQTYILIVLIQVNNQGVGIYGNITTKDNLVLLNTTSYYGYLDNQQFGGSGFVFRVPGNYGGGNAIINVTVNAFSMSGRAVNQTSYIQLNIPIGDVNAPSISVASSAPATVNVTNQATMSVSVSDPTGTGSFVSGIYKVYMAYQFNGGSFKFVQMTLNSGHYDYTFDTSTNGTYSYFVIAIDNAGNLAYISNNNNFFSLSVVKPASTTTTPPTSGGSSSSSTTTTTISTTPPTSSSTPTKSSSGSAPGFEVVALITAFSLLGFSFRKRKRNI